MAEALFNTKDVIEVTAEDVAHLKARAMSAPRQRFRLCLHQRPEDGVQEMVIVCGAGTYFRPHRHPHGRSESCHIIEGTMTVYVFDDHGRVERRIEMGDANSGNTFFYRLCAQSWHLPLPTSETLVYHETYQGPFAPDEVEYAPWSPEEDDPSLMQYLEALEREPGK